MNKIFEKIRSEIGKQKIKLDALSHMTGISVRTIQRILKDDDGKASNVFKICNALGIELKACNRDAELAEEQMFKSAYGINPMKFKDLTLEEVAKILDGDSEKGCGVNGLCDDHCPLWCDEHGTVCSDLAEIIKDLKPYFDNDICYNRKSTFKFNPDFKLYFKIPVKKYYIIQKMFTTPTGNKVGQFVCIVNDELIAKDFCNKYPGCEYKEEIIGSKPEWANL